MLIETLSFHPKSFSEVNREHKSEHSAWETPDPAWWTKHGYAVVRADERGLGQSPGVLDTMSKGTSEAFYDVIEWAADQAWSNGKVGLLGISYYAGSQWRVAARQPKGLSAIVPWEGMSDYYRGMRSRLEKGISGRLTVALRPLQTWGYPLQCLHQILVEQTGDHQSIW